MTRSSLFILTLGLGILAACQVQAPLTLPALKPVPQAFRPGEDTLSVARKKDTVVSVRVSPFDTAALGTLKPKEFFTDPVLLALIDTALAQNLDLKMALQRVESVRGAYRSSRGPLMPTFNGVAQVGLDRFGRYTMNGVGNFDSNLSPNVKGDLRIPDPLYTDYMLGLRSSWEIDFWGKLRSRKKAAYNRLLASEIGRTWVKTQLISEVARQYYQLLALEAEQTIISSNIVLQQTAVELVRAQKSGGQASELGVQQAVAQLSRTQALNQEINQAIVETESRLNILLGRYPQRVERGISINLQPLPKMLRYGVPSQALMRRPDVQAARLELEASLNEANAAQAALYPGFVISPYVGLNAFTLTTFFNVPASVAAGVASGLTLPFLNRLSLTGERNAAKAQAQERFLAYQKSLITSYTEVWNNLNRIQNYRRVYAYRQREFAAQNLAVSAGNELFTAGYANYLELLTAQRGVLEAELGVVMARKEVLISVVDLYQSLGGGWE